MTKLKNYIKIPFQIRNPIKGYVFLQLLLFLTLGTALALNEVKVSATRITLLEI